MSELDKYTVECPSCKVKYFTNPNPKYVTCMDCGHTYYQKSNSFNIPYFIRKHLNDAKDKRS